MISMVFAVFDSAARVYSPPFLVARDEIAKRMFYEACSDRNSTIGKYPSEFALYRLGTFNDEDGSFVCERPGPFFIVVGGLVS